MNHIHQEHKQYFDLLTLSLCLIFDFRIVQFYEMLIGNPNTLL